MPVSWSELPETRCLRPCKAWCAANLAPILASDYMDSERREMRPLQHRGPRWKQIAGASSRLRARRARNRAGWQASGHDEPAPRRDRQDHPAKPAFTTELFLDNTMIEVTPGVSRRLHKPKKHLLNPVVAL